ncbi:class II aldolase/adducin family protein [Extibacter muris]|uniref:class II aldolase/adducin family protein n=1 Tax=Extibacter muris TaxID=1796622 RepID=UPI001D08BFD1|nr:class II aldolase/adducin family protein [Extibacter muris]MCB6202002.1 class II aldolase/adducin family protein [Extibacter muris]MCQ4663325.1 class II aldolase/adducin family protein [Extibacter muris]MCQ4692635.1 class II aldolase/adducin family protein [Extibacter muris]
MKQAFVPIYKELTTAAHRAYARGIQTGSGGNISGRIPDGGMIVKSSGGSFADCTEEGVGWIAMNYDGTLLEGENGKPTREWLLHSILLKNLKQCGAVIHTHSPYTIAWGDTHTVIPLVTWHSRLKIGCALPILDIPAAVVPEKEAHDIVQIFRDNPKLPAVILKGHGIVATGRDAAEAEHTAELVEETAQIALLQNIMKS